MRTVLLLFGVLTIFETSNAQLAQFDSGIGVYQSFYLPDATDINWRTVEWYSGDSVASKTKHYKQDVNSSSELAYLQSAATIVETEDVAVVPVSEEPYFNKGSSQISADLVTHFSASDGDGEASDSESGVIASLSYLYAVAPQLKVGGGFGIMTVKSGTKERIFPLFARAEYQILHRISATLSAGYGFIPTNDLVLNAENGIYSNATVSFDLVGPESAYTSRIGLGVMTQRVELCRTEIVRENGSAGIPISFSQYVERSGWLRRLQITFTHAWRLPTPSADKRIKVKSSKRG